MKHLAIFIIVCVGLGAGNYLFQAIMAHPNWDTAAERTFFQVLAIAATAIAIWTVKHD